MPTSHSIAKELEAAWESFCEAIERRNDPKSESSYGLVPVAYAWELWTDLRTLLSIVREQQKQIEWLAQLVNQPFAPNDHMTSCDKVMGDTHPCTCSADQVRRALAGEP